MPKNYNVESSGWTTISLNLDIIDELILRKLKPYKGVDRSVYYGQSVGWVVAHQLCKVLPINLLEVIIINWRTTEGLVCDTLTEYLPMPTVQYQIEEYGIRPVRLPPLKPKRYIYDPAVLLDSYYDNQRIIETIVHTIKDCIYPDTALQLFCSNRPDTVIKRFDEKMTKRKKKSC